jgi:hypothetical protein
VLGDCADALTLNPVSTKALFRASSALLLMEKYAEAIDCAGRGLAVPGEEGNKALKEVVDKASKRREVKERREGERKERARRETEGKQALELAFQVRAPALLCPRTPLRLCAAHAGPLVFDFGPWPALSVGANDW